MDRKRKNRISWLVVTLVLGGFYGWWIFRSGEWFYTHGQNAGNRAALLKIHETIRVGDGYETVLKVYWQHASEDLRLYSSSPDTWSISMPHELGAREWVLYLDFSNAKVSAIRVRTSDGPQPVEAPNDVGGAIGQAQHYERSFP
ncbi:MAG TPA: hypothetical protein VIF64_03220 [Pyrinomonadaceae bacterium]